jgi:hypothetical protein
MSQQQRTTPDNNPETWERQNPTLSELATRAHQAFERKQARECLNLTDEILRKDPGNADAQEMRSSIQAQMQEDLQRTGAYFRRALAMERARREAQVRKPAAEAGSEGRLDIRSDAPFPQSIASKSAEPEAQPPILAGESDRGATVEVSGGAESPVLQPVATESAQAEAQAPILTGESDCGATVEVRTGADEPVLQAVATESAEPEEQAPILAGESGPTAPVEPGAVTYSLVSQPVATENAQAEAQIPAPADDAESAATVEVRADSATPSPQAVATERARPEEQPRTPAVESRLVATAEAGSSGYFYHTLAQERARRETQDSNRAIDSGADSRVDRRSDPYFRQAFAKEKARREAQAQKPGIEPGAAAKTETGPDARPDSAPDASFRQPVTERTLRETEVHKPAVETGFDERVYGAPGGRDLFAERDAATFPRAVPPAPALAVSENKGRPRRRVVLAASVLLALLLMAAGLLAFRNKFPTLDSLRGGLSAATAPSPAVNSKAAPSPAPLLPAEKPNKPATRSAAAPTPVRTPARTLSDGVAAAPPSAVGRGTLAISSLTSVDIYKDGVLLGSVPVSLTLPAGTHTLEYRHGSLRKNMTYVVNSDETTRAMVSFDVTIRINSKPWADVFIEGVEKTALGQTPISDVKVPVGSVLVFENPQFQPKKYRVTENETAVQNVFP